MQKTGFRNGAGLASRVVFIWTVVVAVGSAGVFGDVGETGAVADKAEALALVSAKPTSFFVEGQGGLLQMADVTIESGGEVLEAILEIRVGSQRKSRAVGRLKEGKNVIKAYVPEVTAPATVEFLLNLDGRTADRLVTKWRPQRHWEVYFVPITHHDLGYTDTIENVLNRYDGFYDDVVRFCEETEDWPAESKYRYTLEGGWSLQHFVENRPPEQIEKFGKYIKNGRIEIGALFGNEISGLCGHEELIRLMYPSFRFNRQFGGVIRTGAITDVPGLSWGLPTVMAGAGVKYFFAGLPTYFEWGRSDVHTFWDESAVLRFGRPDAFWWQGPDGARVLVYYQGSYGFFKDVTGPHSYKYVADNLPGMLEAMEKEDTPFSVMRYIHNGVDNYPPDVEISHIVREWNDKWAYPKLIVATNTMFFEALEKQCKDIRTFRGELPHTDYVVGAVSTAKETGINRITHDRLLAAEKSATIASLLGDYAYPADKLRAAYDNMLLYDEHTWGRDYPAGHVQDWAWNEKSRYAYKAAGIVKPILDRSLRTLAEKVELKDSGRHIVVFNSLSFARTDVVRVDRFSLDKPFDLVDVQTGRKVAHQVVKLDGPQAPVPYAAHRYGRGQFLGHELFDLVFVADDVPSLGYKTYRIVPKEKAEAPASGVAVGAGEIENRFYKVTLDSSSGAVKSIYDKELSREIVDADAVHKVNQFVARWAQTGRQEGAEDVTIRKGQSGAVYGSLVVNSRGAGCPQITQEIILYDRIKRIDFANRILKDSTPLLEIYFAFGFKVENPQFRFEASNSVIAPFRDQFPGSNSNYYSVQHWAEVSDGEIGITLSPRESHLVEFGGLWPCYVSQAHHGVTPPDFEREFITAEQMTKKGHMYSFVLDSNFRTNFQPVQQGDMLFRYSVTSHKGDWKGGIPRRFGWSAGNPLMPMLVHGKREGTLDATGSFCEVDKANVLMLTLKRAEDGRVVIVRLIETEGRAVEPKVSFPSLAIRRAHLTDIVERNKAELSFTEHTVTARLKAFGITTIRLDVD